MKKFFAILLTLALVVSLAACGGGNEPASPSPAPSPSAGGDTPAPADPEPAAADIGDSLVLYSSMTENDLNGLLDVFNEMYPDCNVEIVNGSAGELTARIAAEAGNPQGDIMWGALSNSDGDTHKDIFEHWTTEYEPEIIEAYRSNNGFYNLDHLSTCVFCVNTDLEKELGVTINGYADLLDPKLEGKIVFSDPNSSSAAWNNVCNMMAVFGNDSDEVWDFIEKLMKNKLTISTSSSVCFKSVLEGEYAVGITYEDGVAPLLKSGATNVRMVYPAEGTSASAFGCAVIKGAPHPEAAKAMVNLLMSAEGQDAIGAKLGTLRMTNSKATFETPYLPKNEEIKWADRDVAWCTENKAAVLEKWNALWASING